MTGHAKSELRRKLATQLHHEGNLNLSAQGRGSSFVIGGHLTQPLRADPETVNEVRRLGLCKRASGRRPNCRTRSASSTRQPDRHVARHEINGEMHFWRAVYHEGEVLESFVTKTRDKAAALAFIKKALKRHGSPKAITTDGLRSYKAAMNEIGNAVKKEIGRWANNRCENSHQPFRRRERAMLRRRQMKSLQKFVSVHASCHNHFNKDRHLTERESFKAQRSAALAGY